MKMIRLQTYLAKATPENQEIIRSHYNVLWEKYTRETAYYQEMVSMGMISRARCRQLKKRHLMPLYKELCTIAKMVNRI